MLLSIQLSCCIFLMRWTKQFAAAWRTKTVGTAGKKRTPQMVPRRATEVELDINLFSSSQVMRDGAEPEGIRQPCHPDLTASSKAGMLAPAYASSSLHTVAPLGRPTQS